MTAPIRLLLKRDRPEIKWEVILTFAVYTAIFVLLSLPFVLLDWPPGGGWMDWPSFDAERFSQINREINARVAEECVQMLRSLANEQGP